MNGDRFSPSEADLLAASDVFFAKSKDGTPVSMVHAKSSREMATAGRMSSAEFLALTKKSFRDGALVHVFDWHGLMGRGGVTFRWDAVVAKFGGQSEPIVFATLGLAPNPASFPGLLIFVTSLNAILKSNGTSYRFLNRTPILMSSAFNLIKGATPAKTDEEVILSFAIPRDANNKSLLQAGDILFVDCDIGKTGDTQTFTRNIKLGTNPTVLSNTVIDTYTTSTAGTRGIDDVLKFTVLSTTSIKRQGPSGSQTRPGANTLTRISPVTVTNLDSAIQYFSASFMLFGGTTDVLTAESMSVSILHAAA